MADALTPSPSPASGRGENSRAAIYRATKAAQDAVVKLDAQALGEMEALYRQAAEEIGAAIERNAGMDGNLALADLQMALAQVDARLRAMARARNALLNASLDAAALLGAQPFAAVAVGAALPLPSPLPLAGEGAVNVARVSSRALAFVRHFVAADGLQLSDRVWRLDRQAKEQVGNAIESAVIRGHGAAQAARELLAQGVAVPAEIADKLNAANAGEMARTAQDLLTGTGSPLDNAVRMLRTEINRAHGTAYVMGAGDNPDVVGFRYLLSPQHPKPDICDLLASQNLYGLGAGVYPKDKIATVWPAHPNTLSFLVAVFGKDVSEEDRAGKEAPMDALARLTPERRAGVLGVNKAKAYDDGKISQGMIKSRWRDVSKRIDKNISRSNMYEWDEGKNRRNIELRGLDFADAHKVFAGNSFTALDNRQDYGENRWITMGEMEGRIMVVVHTQRSAGTRIISFRKANERERADYLKTRQ